MKYIITSTFIFIIIIIITIWMVGSKLSAPHQTAQANIPTKEIPAKRVTFISINGNKLVGWLALGDEQHGGVLLMHGVRSNKQQMLNRAIFLNQAGYTVYYFLIFKLTGKALENILPLAIVNQKMQKLLLIIYKRPYMGDLLE